MAKGRINDELFFSCLELPMRNFLTKWDRLVDDGENEGGEEEEGEQESVLLLLFGVVLQKEAWDSDGGTCFLGNDTADTVDLSCLGNARGCWPPLPCSASAELENADLTSDAVDEVIVI